MKKLKFLLSVFIFILFIIASIMFFQFYGNDIIESYYIFKVSPHVVKISKEESQLKGYGTGFYIKAKSGLTYLITNKHVCRLTKDLGTVWVLEEDKRPVQKRVLEQYSKADICLVEAPVNRSGLSLASSYTKDEKVFVMGFPSYMPLTYSPGKIIGYDVFGYFNVTIPILEGNSGSPVLNK